jgi:hypothetical protein
MLVVIGKYSDTVSPLVVYTLYPIPYRGNIQTTVAVKQSCGNTVNIQTSTVASYTLAIRGSRFLDFLDFQFLTKEV